MKSNQGLQAFMPNNHGFGPYWPALFSCSHHELSPASSFNSSTSQVFGSDSFIMAGKAIYVDYESSYLSCILYYSSAQPSHNSGHSHKVGLLLAPKHEASLFLGNPGC
jgi:hypothetical protein